MIYGLTKGTDFEKLCDGAAKAEAAGVMTYYALARMAKELDMSVITEGVESWDQVDFLKGVDINLVQGYLFDKPLSKEDFEQRLANKHYEQ